MKGKSILLVTQRLKAIPLIQKRISEVFKITDLIAGDDRLLLWATARKPRSDIPVDLNDRLFRAAVASAGLLSPAARLCVEEVSIDVCFALKNFFNFFFVKEAKVVDDAKSGEGGGPTLEGKYMHCTFFHHPPHGRISPNWHHTVDMSDKEKHLSKKKQKVSENKQATHTVSFMHNHTQGGFYSPSDCYCRCCMGLMSVCLKKRRRSCQSAPRKPVSDSPLKCVTYL